jgi:endonuclease III
MERTAGRCVDNRNLAGVMRAVRDLCRTVEAPISAFVAQTGRDPYRVLTGCILSLRTQDRVTAGAAARLFGIAPDSRSLAAAPLVAVRKAIYPVGFYRTKAKRLVEIGRILARDFAGRVPDDIDTLLQLPGVGRKTANLVVTVAYGLPGICVDTHVHRITNRWGYVRTRDPDQTERALRDLLPRRYWLELNRLLVTLGQTTCRPVRPRCDACPVERWCARTGVRETRRARRPVTSS